MLNKSLIIVVDINGIHNQVAGLGMVSDFSYTKTASTVQSLCCRYTKFSTVIRLETIVRAQKNRSIALSDHQLSSILGANISAEQIEQALVRSACKVKIVGEKMHVHVPSWRNDLQIPESLVAEYFRLGLTEQIEGKPLCPRLPHNVTEFNQEDMLVQRLREMMLGYGFTETFTYSFSAREDVLPFAQSEACIVQLENPISAVSCRSAHWVISWLVAPGLRKLGKTLHSSSII